MAAPNLSTGGIYASAVTRTQKKAGLEEPRLRYWPREAHTITVQEGLLNISRHWRRGTMRNANAQRANSMVRVGASQQPPGPHVSHAEIGGRCVALANG